MSRASRAQGAEQAQARQAQAALACHWHWHWHWAPRRTLLPGPAAPLSHGSAQPFRRSACLNLNSRALTRISLCRLTAPRQPDPDRASRSRAGLSPTSSSACLALPRRVAACQLAPSSKVTYPDGGGLLALLLARPFRLAEIVRCPRPWPYAARAALTGGLYLAHWARRVGRGRRGQRLICRLTAQPRITPARDGGTGPREGDRVHVRVESRFELCMPRLCM